MVSVSELQLQQITQLAKDGATTVNTNQARIINLADPILGQDAVNLRYLDGYVQNVLNNLSFTLEEVLAAGNDTGGYDINLTGGSQITSSTGLITLNSDVNVTGNLYVAGTTTTINTTHLSVADNFLFLSQGYIDPGVGKSGGIAVNYLPTSTYAAVATTGFHAGVAGVSNPYVFITNVDGYLAAGDIIMISQTGDGYNGPNNGLFEVLDNDGGILTIRGVGLTGNVLSFTENQFVTDGYVAGRITKINVSILESSTDGYWQTSQGSTIAQVQASTQNILLEGGAAGGDLGGTYPNPDVIAGKFGSTHLTLGTVPDGYFLQRSGTTVIGALPSAVPLAGDVTGTLGATVVEAAHFNGVYLTLGAATANQMLVVNGAGTSVIGQAQPTSLPPSGSAGGDLSGTYPNPAVKAITTDAGLGTQLTTGAIPDGYFLQRVGGTVIGAYPSAVPIAGDVTGTIGATIVGAAHFGGTYLTLNTVNDGYVLTRSGSTITGTSVASLPFGAGYDVTGNLGAPVVVSAHFNLVPDGYTQIAFGDVPDGYLLKRIGNTIVGIQSPSGSPTGTAGGDLSGTYPNPEVVAAEFGASGRLTFGAVADGYTLVRSGSSLVGGKSYYDGYVPRQARFVIPYDGYTIFVLPEVPYIDGYDGVNGINFYINGVKQTITDYSVVGNTVTWAGSEPLIGPAHTPSEPDIIEITYFKIVKTFVQYDLGGS